MKPSKPEIYEKGLLIIRCYMAENLDRT